MLIASCSFTPMNAVVGVVVKLKSAYAYNWTFLNSISQRGICQLKRLEDVSRSPWISLTSTSVEGLTTIHAYNKRDAYVEQ